MTVRIIDLTRPLTPGMPLYPGSEPPRAETVATLEREGYVEQRLTFWTHTGTHLDAPAHLIPGGATLDGFAVERFAGPAEVIDCTGIAGGVIGPGDLPPGPPPADGRFLLLHTGWGKLWDREAYRRGYPVLSPEAAALLAGWPLSGIGVDAPSVDPPHSRDLPVHRLLLEAGLLILENLANLDRLPRRGCTVLCLPLPLPGLDGFPVRAVALLGPGAEECP